MISISVDCTREKENVLFLLPSATLSKFSQGSEFIFLRFLKDDDMAKQKGEGKRGSKYRQKTKNEGELRENIFFYLHNGRVNN